MLLFILNPAQGSSNDSEKGIFEALENDQFSKYLLLVVNLLRGCFKRYCSLGYSGIISINCFKSGVL